ncbi:MAG: prolipoprotein diacylglyceryl transferase [Kineosporiaceae bacterium]
MSPVTAVPATLPSPTQGVWQVGPFPLRAYALCILAGIVVAIWLGDRRWRQRGGRAGTVLDIAAWAVPFGIVGGRLYHVLTSWQPYFGAGGHPLQALYIWEGGLGIWGAVTLGAAGAYIGARRAGILMPPLADALAPGIVLAQAIGRWGNWFNNELYGRPTSLPWGLRIYEWDPAAGHAVTGPDGKAVVLGTFHPTFLYESLWDVMTAVVLILIDRRYRIGHGRLFATYALIYAAGRFWIEALRIDPANHILGLRLNLWTSLLVGLGALAYIIVSARLRPGREESVYRDHRDLAEPEEDAETSPATTRWMAWVRSRPNRRAADADDESSEPSETPPDEPETGATAAAGDDSSEDGHENGHENGHDSSEDGNQDGTQDRGEDTLRSEASEDPRQRAEAAKASSSGDVGPADTLT